MNANPPAALSAKQRRFLAAYRQTATVTGAARASGVDHKSHYRWRRGCPPYAEAFDAVRIEAADVLEEEARRRAVDGVRTVRFGRDGRPLIDPETGEPCVEMRYSDRLLIALLRANAPEKFGNRCQTTRRAATPAAVAITLPRSTAANGAFLALCDDEREAPLILIGTGRSIVGTTERPPSPAEGPDRPHLGLRVLLCSPSPRPKGTAEAAISLYLTAGMGPWRKTVCTVLRALPKS